MDHIKSMLNFINEKDRYEYKKGDHSKRLSNKKETNFQRYKAAQKRGDNYAIKLYELKMRMDKIDAEKLKIKSAIAKLQKDNNKNEKGI